jgi:hypothetical protein
VLRKIAFAEILVFGPLTLGDLAHRRPRQKPSTRFPGIVARCKTSPRSTIFADS